MKRFLYCGAVVLLVLSMHVAAGPISVVNDGFELPGTGKTTDFTTIPGWSTDSAPADSGVEINNTLGHDADGDGDAWLCFMMNGDPSVWQTTDHVIAEGDNYELTVLAVNTGGSSSIGISLYADNAGTRTTLATKSIPNGTPVDSTLTFVVPAADPAIGQKLGIELTNDSAGWAGVDNIRLSNLLINTPDPEDGEVGVLLTTDLSWAGAVQAGRSYSVYFDPNEAKVTARDASTLVQSDPAQTYVIPGDLDYETEYFWAVDTYDPNTAPGATDLILVDTGFVWSFTTILQVPDIIAGPEYAYAAIGDTAVFTVEFSTISAISASLWEHSTDDGATWTSVGAGVVDVEGTDGTATLTITDVAEVDAGLYRCTLTNAGGPKTTGTAPLTIKTVLGHWPFDADFNDAVGSNDGVPTAASARAFTPVIGTAEPNYIVGSGAAYFSATYVGGDNDPAGGAVVIPTPERLLGNNSFSITYWEKSKSALSSRYHIASGADVGIENFFMWRYVDPNPDAYAINLGPWAGAYPLFTPNEYPEDQWHFLTVTYSAETATAAVYVDGFLADSGDATTFTGFASEIYVGNRKNMARPFSGAIDDLKIHNYAMNATEVAKEFSDVNGAYCAVKPVHDVNDDCRVNLEDFAVFASAWLECGRTPDVYCGL